MHVASGVVRIADLASIAQPVVEGYQFLDAEVHGPAILIPLQDVHFDDVHFAIPDNRPESLLWLWDTRVRPSAVGGIGLIKCEFRRCTMVGIGLAGPPEVLDVFGPKLGVVASGTDAAVASGTDAAQIHIGELVIGDKITTGDIDATGGSQVVIGKDIVVRLERMGQTELAKAIDQYREEVARADLDTEDKEAQLEALNDVGKELTKPVRNESTLRMKLAALREGAQTSTSLVQAANAIAGLLG